MNRKPRPTGRTTIRGGHDRERQGCTGTLTRMHLGLLPAILIGGSCLINGAARANPPVDEIKKGLCLDLKVNGTLTPCNHSLRLVDDGQGTVTFVTGYGEGRREPKTLVGFATAQTPDMENAYGYALRVTGVTLMADGAAAETQREHAATGLCFMVKPNPMRAGTRAVQQDIVVMCSATLIEGKTDVRRLDWKFVF